MHAIIVIIMGEDDILKSLNGVTCSKHLLNPSLTAIGDCTDGDVRLVGGQNDAKGRVEICVSGIWGSVCEHRYSWREENAAVVCQQLGFHGNSEFVCHMYNL